MIRVTPLRDDLRGDFEKLFYDYYAELGCTDDTKHLVDEYVIPDLLAGLLSIDVLFAEGSFAGFIIYQKDDIDNEWNFKEGWGDIREIYVAPPFRKNGYGRFLLYTAEMKLKESGVQKAYCLPYEDAVPFFSSCGYVKTDEYCEEMDCPVFEKTNLDNTCKHGG